MGSNEPVLMLPAWVQTMAGPSMVGNSPGIGPTLLRQWLDPPLQTGNGIWHRCYASFVEGSPIINAALRGSFEDRSVLFIDVVHRP
jgi:hypothetical protein